MSILDDAIREHLELKRAHGADESELKRLEDEAFGPPGRPDEADQLAEAPTEFMATPEAPEAAETAQEGGRRPVDVADLQEPPPPEPAPVAPAEDAAQGAPPAEEPVVAEDVEEPAAERQAIAEQPTELFDVEAEIGTEDAPPTEAASPSDEEIVAAEIEEPRVVPVAGDEEEEDEEFWSEQRLSDELDQALEGPLTEEHEAPQLADEDDVVEDDEQAGPDYDPDTGHEDVLEDTPDFLEDAPEDDELWFEQRPPKDFDFDD